MRLSIVWYVSLNEYFWSETFSKLVLMEHFRAENFSKPILILCILYIHNKLSFCFVEHEKCYVCLFVHLHVCLIAWEHVYSYYVSVVKIVNMTLVCNEISLSHTFILYLNLIANISFLGTIKLEQESQLFIGVKYFDKISQTQKTKLMIGDYFTEKSNC